MNPSFPYRNVCVIGTSGSGKTTLSRELAHRIGAKYIELDAIFHLPSWVDMDPDEFRDAVAERMRAERWVIDGNYMNYLRHLLEADLIIWLDYPFHIVLRRMLWRTVSRAITKKELWNGNRESFRNMFSKESMVVWVFQTYWKRKKLFTKMIEMPAYSDSEWLHFRHPRDARAWLKKL
ncbi:MAG TPA: AAA family ATPase [Candidatus Kapabacteria bacterium]|jgi:adenylate kinase family enzyme